LRFSIKILPIFCQQNVHNIGFQEKNDFKLIAENCYQNVDPEKKLKLPQNLVYREKFSVDKNMCSKDINGPT
jgi:hypothetical protein